MDSPPKYLHVFPALAVVTLCAAVLLVLAACGGTSTSSAIESPPPSTAAVLPAATPTVTPTPSPTLYPSASWRPGGAGLAATAAVARRWVRLLHTQRFASSHIWAAEATFDNWPSHMHYGSGSDVKKMYMRAPASTDKWWRFHVLVRPGVAVLEDQFSPTPGTVLAALQLLAVDEGKIVHDEVFYNIAPGVAKPVRPWPSAPGPADIEPATMRTVTSFLQAMADDDLPRMARRLSPDVLFYDTAQRHGKQGSERFAAWWRSRAPVTFHDMKTAPRIFGEGWAVARWTATGADASTSHIVMPGATVYEVRDGKIVRLTLYYDSGTLPLHE